MTSLKTIAEKFAAWRRYREAVRELSQLSDRELADIGIRRGDIHFVVANALAAISSGASGSSLRTHPPRRASPDACNARRFLPRRAFCLRPTRRARLTARRGFVTSRPCAPSMSSAAASPAAKRPGRSPSAGVPVVLHEMRPRARHRGAPHRAPRRARLLQFVPLRRRRDQRGRRHPPRDARARFARSCARPTRHQVPAGGALAVDRDGFSAAVEAAIAAEPLIRVERGEIAGLPPDGLGQRHHRHRAADLARARRGDPRADRRGLRSPSSTPSRRSCIAIRSTWRSPGAQSRYDKAGPGGSGADYLNCPMSREQYEAFVDALLAAEKTEFREFEGTPYFDGCLPIEVMAERGRETLRHGPMKPVGLTNAHDPTVKPYAVVQLRQDNALGTLFNMVGFQTKLKYGEQARVLPPDPRAGAAPNSRGSAACTATPSSIRRACSTRGCGSRRRRACASPARSPAAKAMSRAPRSA